MPVDGDIVLSVGLNASDAIDTSNNLMDDIKQIFNSAGSVTPVGFKKLQMAMDKASISATQIIQRLQELESTTFDTPEYASIVNQLNAIDTKYTQLSQKRRDLEASGKIDTSAYKKLESTLEDLYNRAEKLRQAKEDMERGGTAFISGTKTEEYEQLVQKLNQVNNQMVILRQQALEFGNAGVRSSETVNKSFVSLTKITNRLVTSLQKVISTIRKVASSSVSGFVDRLKSKFSGLSKSSDDTAKSLERTLKTLFKYVFGVRSFFFLYRKIRKAITEGFGDLAQVSEPFNAAMSSIINALANLKSSLSAAFAPIIQFVAPALTTFINLVAKAVDAIGMLIAALTGQKTYMKAIPVQQDYAASVDKTASSAKSAKDNLDDASDSAKKLHRQLAGFDDVEILKSPDESGSGGSGGGAGSGLSSVETPLSEAFTSLSELLKKAWENADFYDIGRIVGEKLRDALLSIPWDIIKQTLKKIATSVATFLNGYFETPGLFATIGITIAQGINSAFVFLYNFITNFHWDSYGKAIRTRLTSALNNIEWGLIYRTFAGFGTGLAEYLNELFKPDTFEAVGNTVGHLLNSAFEFLNNFGDTFDFTQFGTSIARGINQFLRTFDSNRLAYGINKFITGFSDAIIAFMSTVNWYDLGLEIRNLLVKIDWKAALSAVGKFVWEALNASVLTLRGLFNADNIEGPFSDALNELQTTLNKAADEIDFRGLAQGFESIVEALAPVGESFAAGLIKLLSAFIEVGSDLINVVGSVFQKIGDVIKEIDPLIVEQLDALFNDLSTGIVVADKYLSTIAGYIEDICDAINGLDHTVLSWITNVLTILTGGVSIPTNLNELAGEITSVGNASTTAVGSESSNTGVAGFGNAVNRVLHGENTLTTKLVSVAESIAETGTASDESAPKVLEFNNRVNSLDTLGAGVEKSATLVSGAIKEIGTTSDTSKESTSGLQNVFGAFEGLGFSVPLKIALLSAAVAYLGEKNGWSKEQVAELQTKIDNYDAQNPKASIEEISKAFESVGVTAEDMADAVLRSSKSLTSDLKKEYNGIDRELRNAGENGIQGLIKGMDNKKEEVKTVTKDITNNKLIGTLLGLLQENSPSKKLMEIGQNAIQGLINGIKQKENLLTTTMKTMANSLIRTLEATYSQFSNIGRQIINYIYTGMSGSVSSVISLVYNMIYSIQGSFYSMDWYSIGSNIGNGIYNGLASSANRLAVLAWNVAVSMFNSARNALGIRSPSKKFAWIGEMVSTGLGEGVEDKAGLAVSKLQTLLTTLENLGSATTIPMPDVAMGRIAPYSTSTAGRQDAQSLSSITDAVNAMHSDALTRNDIIEIINTAMRNFTVDLYIGDEQIARHANNGNLKLSRRYGMVT